MFGRPHKLGRGLLSRSISEGEGPHGILYSTSYYSKTSLHYMDDYSRTSQTYLTHHFQSHFSSLMHFSFCAFLKNKGNSSATPYPTTLCTTFTCGKPPHHLGPTNIPQHLKLQLFQIFNYKYHRNFTSFFFFLLKPICEKA